VSKQECQRHSSLSENVHCRNYDMNHVEGSHILKLAMLEYLVASRSKSSPLHHLMPEIVTSARDGFELP